MHIVFIHTLPLPVKKYGGTERVVYWLMKGLVEQGHKVTLVGNPSSNVESIGVNLIKWDHNANPNPRSILPENFDIIHSSTDFSNELEGLPFLLTVHGIGKREEQMPLNTVFVSKKHAEIHGSDQFVYNGLDLSEYTFIERKRNWKDFMFLAKASWKVKNLKDCKRAVKEAGKRLHIAGGKGLSLSRSIKYWGMVDQQQKMRMFAECDALLFPVRWNEPFGIAMIEAMAIGTPVIGSGHGSLNEVINDISGIKCQNYNEFLMAIKREQSDFDPRQIRQYVEENFSSVQMTQGYIEKYKKIIDGANLNKVSPTYCFERDAQDLLPF